MNTNPHSEHVGMEWTSSESLIVDCGSCLVRSKATCADCVVSALMGPNADDSDTPEASVTIDTSERDALRNLAESGLVPPLRLVVSVPDPQFRGMGS